MHQLALSDGIINNNKRECDDTSVISYGLKCCESMPDSTSSHQYLTIVPSISSIPTTITSKEPRKVFNRERMNLESHQLIWLDKNVNSSEYENQMIITTLRKIVDYTKLFYSIDEFQQYIEQAKYSKTFVVCSGQMSEIILPQIHSLEHIWSIYIYCHNEDCPHQDWASNWSKIKGVYTQLDELLHDLSENVQQYLKQKDGIFNGSGIEDNTTDRLWSWWIPLINLLCQLSYPYDFHYRLVDSLKVYYENKDRELEILEEFKREYKPDTALRWYTRPTFLYRLVNTASRQHNTELMFACGFFLQDIYRQLKNEHEKLKLRNREATFKVYRGQIMSQNEIKNLVHRLLQPNVAISSLLSTSADRSVSLVFIPEQSELPEGYQRVLFEIEANLRQHTRPFADISHLSYIADESEILFMIGAELKIAGGDIYYDENENIWIIKSKLVYGHSMNNEMDFDDMDFNNTITRRKLKLCISEALYDCRASIEELNTIFNELVNLYRSERWIQAVKLQCIGRYQEVKQMNYPAAVATYNQALQIWFQYVEDKELNCSFDIANTYASIGYCYRDVINDLTQAKINFDLAIKYYQSGLSDEAATDHEKTMILNKLTHLYKNKIEAVINADDKTEKVRAAVLAIQYQELALEYMLKYYSFTDIEIGTLTRRLADFYNFASKYDEALMNYRKALEIYMQQCEPDLISISSICSSLVEILIAHKHDYDSALQYHLIGHAHTLQENIVKPTDIILQTHWKKENVAKSHETLADIYIALNEYGNANEHFLKVIELYQEINIEWRDNGSNMKRIKEKMKPVST